MANAVLSAPHFQDEAAAFAHVEAKLWPNGPVCPFCRETKRVGRLKGKTTRPGLCKCYACQRPFTVRMGTIFESSHLPLRLWLQAIYLMCASKKGVSTRQIQRMLKCSMKTAWFLTHRIRETMKPSGSPGPLGGAGKVVEADETFLGRSAKSRPITTRPPAILSLVERGAAVRSMPMLSDPNAVEILQAMYKHVHPDSTVHTDGAQYYKTIRMHVAAHETVNHSAGEYVRCPRGGAQVHTNSLEGYFSIFKRGLVGVYQIMSPQHLHRYCHEFDFRYSNRERLGINDTERAEIALKGAKGKRLTYKATLRSEDHAETSR